MIITIIWLGFMLDLIAGDPEYSLHPIRIMGHFIKRVERYIRTVFTTEKTLKLGGLLLWCLVVLGIYFSVWTIIKLAFTINFYLAIFLQIFLVYSFLATRALIDATMKIYYALKKSDLIKARRYLSYIVGRDTKKLDETRIVKATIETVSENCVDGIIAPLFYYFIGGVPLMAAYKAVNTLDSMVGYNNEKYQIIGFYSAKLDDIFNYIPARLSLLLITLSAYFIRLDYKNAFLIGWRDRYQHKSPNSAWSEAATAGALGIQLGGDNYYFGKLVEKPTIGDAKHAISIHQIKISNSLILLTSIVTLLIFSSVFYLL